MRAITFLIFGCLTLLGCPRSDLGDELFRIDYPGVPIFVPPGQPAFQTFVNANASLVTGFLETLDDRELTEEEVDNVSGLRARVTSLNGEDFREIERMELRVCPASELNCTQIDIMFSVSDLSGRRQNAVDLNPGLRNFKPLFFSEEAVRVELVMFPTNVTNQAIEARLDWSIRAVGGL